MSETTLKTDVEIFPAVIESVTSMYPQFGYRMVFISLGSPDGKIMYPDFCTQIGKTFDVFGVDPNTVLKGRKMRVAFSRTRDEIDLLLHETNDKEFFEPVTSPGF